jgi:hypothetical protein
MNSSAFASRARGSFRRTRTWSVRLALTLLVGVVFALGSSGDAHTVSRETYFTSGSSFCIGERSSTLPVVVQRRALRRVGDEVTREL